MSRAEIREQLNQLEYFSKRLSALQSQDATTRKNAGEEEPLILRSKEELEQEADHLSLDQGLSSPPPRPRSPKTTFSTGPPYHLATIAPEIGLPLPPPPPPPSKLSRPPSLPGLNPTLGQPHAPFLPPIPEAYIPPPPVIPTTTAIQSVTTPNPATNSNEPAQKTVTSAPTTRGTKFP